jgi:UDP-N-acetyl-2-amino-2-deoxyglucuronate dehydrogenase
MNKLRLGVVGCGDIAGFTALVSKLIPRVKLTACCDLDLERAKTFAGQHRIPHIFSDYSKMLTQTELDAAYLAVPHHLHYQMILSAVEAGLPVFVEKPLTRTLAEGMELLSKYPDAKIGVNYQYRYDRGCYALARAVQAGRLGNVHSARINIPWHRTQGYFDSAAWHKTIAQAGGGSLITQGSHFLDIVLWALGELPISAMGYTMTAGFDVEVDTVTHGIVETDGGALISITSSMIAAEEQTVTIEIYGSRGAGVYRNRPWPSVRFTGVRVRKQHPPERGVHALQRSLAGFASWVLADKPFLTPAKEAIPVLAAVDGIYRSAESGGREPIAV